MKKIGIVLKPDHPQGKAALEHLIDWLQKRGREALLIQTTGPERTLPPALDMLIVLGGDGTLLSAARMVEGLDIPILGVNLGSLGFLTEVTLEELYPTLEKIFKEQYILDPRVMLKSTIRRGENEFPQPRVLNDVVISHGTLAKLIRLEITINHQFVTWLRADGLIVSTATGSTAYSLAAGGPILHPSLDAILLTPISPHMLTNRPIVVPADVAVEVVVKSTEKEALVTFDGQETFPLQGDDVIHIEASERRLKLIQSPHRNYYQVLRQKLKWGEG
ncbi:MAG: NAD(+)/NADH kinase [Nitrospirae bacterium]|nr:NAD(+)/NADH kinase [Candidatus Manganitrophaceae bacterium]